MHMKKVRPFRRIRRAAALTLALGLAATTAACSAEASGAQAGGNTGACKHAQLNYWDMQWGGPAFMNALKGNVQQFNKEHKNIQVKFQQLAWGDYSQKLLSAVQAGNPPDIGGGDSGIPFNMNAQGQTLDISDLYKQWEKDGTFADMPSWAYDKWKLDGKALGITWQFDQRAIFYRTDLFKAAGIKPPTTWDELLAAAKKLNKPDQGQIGIAFPGKQGTYDTDQFYMTFVMQAGGGLSDVKGNPTFNTPQQLEALKFVKQLRQYAAPGTPSWTFTEVNKAFDQGKAAMAFGGGWFLNDIKKNAPKVAGKIGVLPVLIGPGGVKAQHSVSFANPWMIYKQTKCPAEAKTFLKWMMKKENLQKLYASEPGGKWPVYRSLLNDPIYSGDPLRKELAKQVVEHGVDYWYPNNAGAVGIASMGTGIADIIVNPVLTGQVQPADALADAQKKLGPVFAKQGK
jgi:ABC-type glycerol-3-phosphate transport system substrate-binding protein